MSDTRKTKILWVTHDFPPRRSSGIYRPIKINKYLDGDRYAIEFLTQSMFNENISLDENLLYELEPTPPIHRVPNIVLDNYIGKMLKRRHRDHIADKGASEAEPKAERPKADEGGGLMRRLYKLWMMAVYFPDQYFLWGWMAAFRAALLHLKNRYDIVYTTSHPQSGHMPGFLLKAMGVKWVADYRDAGILSHYFLFSDLYTKGWIRLKIERLYQKLVLHACDHVITHSSIMKESFSKEFSVRSSKMTEISNGYDESDFARQRLPVTVAAASRGELHMLHMGIWYLTESEQRKVTERIERLAVDLAAGGVRLIVNALGHDLFSADSAARSTICFDYRFYPSVAHHEVIPHLLGADVYLMANTMSIDMSGFLPGKLWEYLRGGKPIVYFGEKGEAWEIIQECATGIFVDFDDALPIDAARLIEACRRAEENPRRSEKHNWKSRAMDFDKIFSNIRLEASL